MRTNATLHPGHYVNEWLQRNNKTQKFLAFALDFEEPFISKIVNGKAHISPKIAIKLEIITRISASKWMKYETDYMLARTRARVQ